MGHDAEDRRAGLSAAKRELLKRRLRGETAAGPPAIPRADRGAPLPLSFNQERLWFLDRLGLGVAYNMAQGLTLRGPLDVGALRRAVEGVVRRHEVLRTSYSELDGEPVQVIHPPAPFALAAESVPEGSAEARDAAVRRRFEEELRRPFDLEREPPLRLALLRLSGREHVLLVTLHHIAGDDWSQEVFLGELFSRYAAEVEGRAAELPELAVQYADFAAWQRARSTPEVQARELEYWTGKLEGLRALDLPLDRVRPPVQTFPGGSVDFRLDPENSRALLALARERGVTTATLLLSAFCVLLGRTARQTDVAVGSPVANRSRQELEGLVGFFVSTVVMRADLSGDPTFDELLRRMQRTTVEAQEHQELPFERIVDALVTARDPSRNPLFQVLFAMMAEGRRGAQPESIQMATQGALELQPLAIDSEVTRFDLELNVRAAPEGIAGRLVYNTDLFEHATIERMAGHLVHLLAECASRPGARISELRLVSPDERLRLLGEWNATARDLPRTPLVHGCIAEQAARTPDAPAVIFEGTTLSYRELDDRANQLARWLVERGVGPETLVGLCLDRSLEMVVGILGVLKAGGAYLPIDPEHPDERIGFVLEDARVALLLTSAEIHARIGECLPAALRTVFVWGRDEGELAELRAEAPACAALPGNPAYAIYTSGSTGRPKAVVNTHAGILNRLHWMQSAYALGAADRVLQKTPYTFDVSVWEFLWPLMSGATLVLARPGGHRDPAYLMELIAERGVTTLHFVPSMLRAFLDQPGLDQAGPALGACLRRVICSGEALPADLRDAFFAGLGARGTVQLENLYGPTEAAVDVTAQTCAPEDRGASVSIGGPIANTVTYVLDAQLEPVPVGVPGELYLGGVQLARGYLHRPELSAERFVPDPFGGARGAGVGGRLYRTGDLVRWRADGTLEYLGRTDSQVKLRGYRIELGEIEAVLRSHAGVRAAAVSTWSEGGGDALLVGYVVLGALDAPDLKQLAAHLAERLPAYMVPDVLMPLDALPMTTSGKLDRRSLPAPSATRDVRAPYRPPASPIEEELAELWVALLPVERVGLDDSFFDLGGHSLLATRLFARIRTNLGIDLPLRTVFDAPTLGGMSEAVLRILLEDDEGAEAPEL